MTPEQTLNALRNRSQLERRARQWTTSTNFARVRLGLAALTWLRGANLKAFCFVDLAKTEGGEPCGPSS